ncbi:hypothetical protein LF41_1552 [Lysobacter dokdonensis DS-58]|uniref:Uncharacterized protein n=1 Tax=Lysobacter dokdonensis DS-58 TaxID=1300345 RepID=A0A0A2WEM9_9GAMM|nr:hypothetical protein [Lysobacter dokdonensis]KGQ18198.1 hypothetical protein LF41_1552 [Lysobacter dokdonensis DS-58]
MSDPTPLENNAPPHSLRDGVHDLRNVLNAVQMNAYAARKLVDEPARTLACIARIEAAVERGNGVLAHMPTDESLSTAALVLRERLQHAGGDLEVALDGEDTAPVPGLLRQALCVVAVESQALGARAFRLWMDGGLACEAHGLASPGPIAIALAESNVPELRVSAHRTDGGWTFRWALPPAQ